MRASRTPRVGVLFAAIALIGTAASAQITPGTAPRPIPLERTSIADSGRNPDGVTLPGAQAIVDKGLAPLFWDNGPLDNVTAHLSQQTPIGNFYAADDFFIKHDFWACIDSVTVCFAVSDTVDGVMTKPTFGLAVYNDCSGRPDTLAYEQLDPTKIHATLVGPSAFAGFNLWSVTFEIHEFVDGYQRPWISAFGVGDLQDVQYYWLSANNGVIQGAQAQLKNGAETWMDAEQCDCPGICTDLYFVIAGHQCCLAKDNTPFDPAGGAKSLQLKGATIDTARAADNFQIGPYDPQVLCAVEAWMATNCPLDKIFLEIYENVCNMPGAKLFTIDDPEQPSWEPVDGLAFEGVPIYRLFWKLEGTVLQPGQDYWLSVVAQGTGSILDKAVWMFRSQTDPAGNLICHINITEGQVRDPFVAGMEDWIPVSQDLRTTIHHDFAFRLWTRPLPEPPPVTGACCTSSSCTDDTLEADCLSAGGVFFPNQICANNPCATVIAGCCLPTGGCQDMLEADCTAIGGAFLPGQNCVTATCEFACCTPAAGCIDSTVGLCAIAGGTIHLGESCATFMCPAPATGACCLGNGVGCVDLTGDDCIQQSGVSFDPDASCAQTSCAGALGACCLANRTGGACSDNYSLNDCQVFAGVFAGPGTDCTTSPCEFGACCIPGGACVENIFEPTCTEQGGSFISGATCANACPGACCFPDGSCSDLTEGDCNAAGGSWDGTGECAVVACPPAMGACCLAGTVRNGGDCVDTTEAECSSLGGDFSVGIDCLNSACQLLSSPSSSGSGDGSQTSDVTDTTRLPSGSEIGSTTTGTNTPLPR